MVSAGNWQSGVSGSIPGKAKLFFSEESEFRTIYCLSFRIKLNFLELKIFSNKFNLDFDFLKGGTIGT